MSRRICTSTIYPSSFAYPIHVPSKFCLPNNFLPRCLFKKKANEENDTKWMTYFTCTYFIRAGLERNRFSVLTLIYIRIWLAGTYIYVHDVLYQRMCIKYEHMSHRTHIINVYEISFTKEKKSKIILRVRWCECAHGYTTFTKFNTNENSEL